MFRKFIGLILKIIWYRNKNFYLTWNHGNQNFKDLIIYGHFSDCVSFYTGEWRWWMEFQVHRDYSEITSNENRLIVLEFLRLPVIVIPINSSRTVA